MGKMIDIQAGDGTGSFSGYLALPASGKGPGVVIGQEIFGVNATMRAVADFYAEEGYVALVPDLFWRLQPGVDLGYTEADFSAAIDLFQRMDVDKAVNDIDASFKALRSLPQVEAAGLGYVGFCMGGKLAYLTATRTDVACAVGYYGMGIEHLLEEADNIKGRLVLHFAEQDGYCDADARAQISRRLGGRAKVEIYTYPNVDHAFARAGGIHYNKPAALMVHERSIAALKQAIGPDYNLSDLWDKHVEYEFVMCFTHTREIDWMLPNVAPTGKYVEIPMLGVIKFRGDKLCHEHIYWDQASVLVQIGLLDPTGLPVIGIESAKKLLDEQLPSNTLMDKWESSKGR